MSDEQQQMHFGLNCRLLKREQYSPADCRCTAAIDRYAAPKHASLETKTAVPVKVAARLLDLSEPEVVRRAKAGELEYGYLDDIAKRVTLFTKKGPREYTLNEAAKALKITHHELTLQIDNGEFEAFYPDRFMQIAIVNRWEYEKCPLIDTGGVCGDFQPHDGPKIRCIADVAEQFRGAE